MSEPQPTEDDWLQVRLGGAWIMLRRERASRLADSDWTQFNDSPLESDKKAEWATYRQELRDVTKTTTDPTQVVWPTPPQ